MPICDVKVVDLPDTKKERNVFEVSDRRGKSKGCPLRLFWESGEVRAGERRGECNTLFMWASFHLFIYFS